MKAKRFVQEIVTQEIFPRAYGSLYASVVQEDDCPCCVESAYPWLEDEARVQAEIEAALVCSEPVRPVWGTLRG